MADAFKSFRAFNSGKSIPSFKLGPVLEMYKDGDRIDLTYNKHGTTVKMTPPRNEHDVQPSSYAHLTDSGRASIAPARFADQTFVPGSGAVQRYGYDHTELPADECDDG
jgi:hypothetical protein